MKMYQVFILSLLFLDRAAGISTVNGTDSVDTFFEFINEAQSQLKVSSNKNIILVLGGKESDKSLLVHSVAGDYSKVKAKWHDKQYRIDDGLDPEIKNNGSNSAFRLVLPKMTIDEAGNVWYDLPAFDETRSEIEEITAALVTKSLIENAEQVKIVLVVNRTFFTGELDRLLTHTSKLIKNVDRYESSVSLVVAKVPSKWREYNWSLEKFENSVIVSTAKFLRSLQLQNGLNGSGKVQLINALLTNAAKISVFWRPNAAGAFDTIDEMVYGRRQIRESVLEHSSYTKRQQNDFDFPLSEASQTVIAKMARHTIDNMSEILMDIDERVFNALQHTFEQIVGFFDRQSFLRNITSTAQLNAYEDSVLDPLTESIINLNLTTINAELSRIRHHKNQLNVLSALARPKIEFSIRGWVAKSSVAHKYVTTNYNWHSFLVRAYELVGNNESQFRQGLTIDERNFSEFKKKFPNSSELEVTPSKLKELNEVIAIALIPTPTYKCSGDTMTIKEQNLKSSRIQPSKCLPNHISEINVYIVGTFFVDSDMNLTGYRALNIFANKWKVLRTATFNLNGREGNAQQSPPQFPGTGGEPGDAGTNAANFFGLTNELENGNALTVNVIGGDGANGQDGSGSVDLEPIFSGYEDNTGTDTPITSLNITPYYNEDVLKKLGYNVEYYSGISHDITIRNCDDGPVDIYYTMYPYGCCGRTGQGGAGGSGGHSGNHFFLNGVNDKSNSPIIHASDGLRGSDGQNATPCKNTAFLIKVKVKCKSDFGFRDYSAKFNIERRIISNRCRTEYARSSVEPPMSDPVEPLKLASGIIEYKAFLRENMKIASREKDTRKTYDAIESNAGINNRYSAADFALELNMLEEQFYELNEQVDFLPFYDSLLQRLDNYSMSNENNISTTDREVLALIYTTILSKTLSMRSSHKSDFIIDIETFFDLIIENMKKLDEAGRIKMINEQRDNYNGTINAKIDETNAYIANVVQPAIEKLFALLDDEMQNGIDETIKMQANAIEAIEVKEENAKIIRRNAFIRLATEVLDVVAKAALIFGLEGKTVCNMVQAGTDFTRTKFLADPELEKFEVPAAVKIVQNELEKSQEKNDLEKIDAIEDELQKLIVSLENLKAGKFQLAGRLNDFLSKMKSIRSKRPFERVDVGQRLGEISAFVRGSQKKLIAIEGTVQIVRELHKTENALIVIASSSSLYKQYSTNREELDAIGVAINEDRNALIALIAFKNKIYGELIPMIKAFHENVDAIETNLATKSSVALDVQKWKFGDTLSSVKRILVESISGLKTSKKVENSLARIDEAITLLMHIYDRIQNYQEQTKLVKYMSDLHTADYRRTHITDLHLKQILNQLEFNCQANFILSQYGRAVDAFKQAVFPFAADYLEFYQLPVTIAEDHSMDSVIVKVVDKVKLMSERIKELNGTVINKNDESMHTAHFDRNRGGPGPFYLWPNDEVHNEIQQLFAGKKVYLLADVTQSGKLNAVKFNVINVVFRTSNQTTNEQLEEILQSFHVSMTHMGESDYRCNEQFYTIRCRPQTIAYNFAKNDFNGVYGKLSAGINILSPYTLWAIQLSRGQFEQLEPFVDIVDIELHGHGQYVVEGAKICGTDLTKYYTPLPARPQVSTLQRHFVSSGTKILNHTPTHTLFVTLILLPLLVAP